MDTWFTRVLEWFCFLGLVAILVLVGWGLTDIHRRNELVTIRIRTEETDVQAPARVEGCPTEDSCRIDYHDGAWYITPQVP